MSKESDVFFDGVKKKLAGCDGLAVEVDKNAVVFVGQKAGKSVKRVRVPFAKLPGALDAALRFTRGFK